MYETLVQAQMSYSLAVAQRRQQLTPWEPVTRPYARLLSQIQPSAKIQLSLLSTEFGMEKGAGRIAATDASTPLATDRSTSTPTQTACVVRTVIKNPFAAADEAR